MPITKGCALGYRKSGEGGRWIAKYVGGGVRKEATLGPSDDALDADGATALSFAQAQEKARLWFSEAGREAAGEEGSNGLYTVADAARDYMEWFRAERKSVRDTQYMIDAHILPTLGKVEVPKLTAKRPRRHLVHTCAHCGSRGGYHAEADDLRLSVGHRFTTICCPLSGMPCPPKIYQAMTHGLAVSEQDDAAKLVAISRNNLHIKADQPLDDLVRIEELKAPVVAVVLVEHSTDSDADFEHELKHAANSEHPDHLWNGDVESRFRVDVLDHRVAKHEVEEFVVEGKWLSKVGNRDSVRYLGMQLFRNLDAFLHRIDANYIVASAPVVIDVPCARAATRIQAITSRSDQLFEPAHDVVVAMQARVSRIGIARL